jgi:hypothetical protein
VVDLTNTRGSNPSEPATETIDPEGDDFLSHVI